MKALQVFLNVKGFIVAPVGTGSRGKETTYYGPATAAAVSRFQERYKAEILTPQKLTKGNGVFDTLTKTKANALNK